VGAGAVDEGTAVEESHWTVVYGRGARGRCRTGGGGYGAGEAALAWISGELLVGIGLQSIPCL
jgi:hypothetical protein